MSSKQEIKKQTKSEKIFGVIPKSLKEKVIRYKAKTNMSESEIVNVALNEFFKVKMLKEDVDDITEIMGKAIDNKLGKRFERMLMLLAKAGKSSYASLFLQAYFLSKICQSEDSKEFLKEKIDFYLSTSFHHAFPEIQIKKMKRRWGACFYQKNRVCFNLVLAHIDYALIDYVIVHELCHFLEANHSKAFYHEIEKRMPDYKERERLLKDVGI